ncbi:MAG: LuxR C-terminal-related transcriptional regulator [Acidimicrobiales bacterium]
MKDASVDEILEAVRATSSRRIEVDPAAIQAVLLPGDARPAGLTELTQRELEVLAGLGEGRPPKQIARHLGITLPTCRGHIKSLFQKLGAHTGLEAVVVAHRYGILQLPDDERRPAPDEVV